MMVDLPELSRPTQMILIFTLLLENRRLSLLISPIRREAKRLTQSKFLHHTILRLGFRFRLGWCIRCM